MRDGSADSTLSATLYSRGEDRPRNVITREYLAEMSQLLREYSRTGDLQLRERLILGHEGLVRYVIGRFKPSGSITYDDLLQTGHLGLIAAIERFDSDAGVPFVTFAVPTIIGTVKHYLRDHAWTLKAPRRLRELGLQARKVRANLEHTLGRVPTPAEVAVAAGVSEEEILQAMDVDQCFLVLSLDAREGDGNGSTRMAALEGIGVMDPALGRAELQQSVQQAMAELDDRLRLIIHRRFFRNATQMEVARDLGISQMHVSRLERKALRILKDALH